MQSIMRTIVSRLKARPILSSLLISAVVVGSAGALLAVKVQESRMSNRIFCGQKCYKIVRGEWVEITDRNYERAWRVERGRTLTASERFFGRLGRAVDVLERAHISMNQERLTEKEKQRFAERRQRLMERIRAKRAARQASMAAYLVRTGQIPAEEPQKSL